MTRSEFSVMIARMITQMSDDGLTPAIDYAKRSDQEQARLFALNDPEHHVWVTSDDGVKHISDHQRGKAVDLLLFDGNGALINNWPDKVAKKYHALWESWGGKPVIPKDIGHFCCCIM